MKRLMCWTICLAMLLSFVLCAAASEGLGPVKFGVLAPLTGTNAEYGKAFDVGTKMAVDEINVAGGVNGRLFELEISDSKGDPKESSDLCRQYVDDEKIMAIIGDFTSSTCMANAPIVDSAGLVQLSPTASNPKYAGMSDYCFTTMGAQDVEAPFFVRYIIKKFLGFGKVGVIYINSDWGKACFEHFKKQCEVEGVDIVSSVNYVQDEKDFSSLITRLKAADPEVICIMDQGAVPQIINQIRSINWDVKLTALSPGTSQQILDLCGKNAEGLVVSSLFFFDPDKPELVAWGKEYTSRSGLAPTHHPVLAYDCVYLLAEAVKACGDGPITRQAIRDNLAKVEMVGMSGPIKFNEEGGVTSKYLICEVENGQYVLRAGYDYSEE